MAQGPDDSDLLLMRLLDEKYIECPYYGVQRMTVHLHRQGFAVNAKRVRRLLRTMGLMAIYEAPKLNLSAPGHAVYPYLLRGVSINRVDQVWAADITYLRLSRGFGYLMAILDWYSRYVLAWSLSNSLEAEFCVRSLELALSQGCPAIFNTDQGSQFSSISFTGLLQSADVKISMDGRGRAFDNIIVERLWRTVKYEEVFLHDYGDLHIAKRQLTRYFQFYNEDRPHQSLDWQTPGEYYRRNR